MLADTSARHLNQHRSLAGRALDSVDSDRWSGLAAGLIALSAEKTAMATPILKFIHASDFHLERAAYGLAEIPPTLQDPLLDAPYLAVESIFTAAILEEVDFVVLSGDILSGDELGPRSLLFLVEQFERLSRHQIAVYWAPGGIDPPLRWQPASLLPDNVQRLLGNHREVLHHRQSGPAVRLLGPAESGRLAVRAVDYQGPQDDLFTIAVGYGTCRVEPLCEQAVDYWALGGEHRRASLHRGPTIHYPGTPQGRCPLESGPRGCTLVEVDAAAEITTSPLVTDAIRWHTEELAVEPGTSLSTLSESMQDRLQCQELNASSRPLLISWRISGSGTLLGSLQASAESEKLLSGLRSAAGKGSTAWSVSLEVINAAACPDEWYEEESMLGEFLRNVQDLQGDESQSLDVQAQLPPGAVGDQVAAMLDLSDATDRQAVLSRAADLGVQLLSGQDSEES
jgi:hypothetical protein